MYNSQNVADRIKSISKNKHISVKTMLKEIGLGEQTLQNMKNSMPKADNLAKIADYLECSVDYLLGRTDDIKSIQSTDEPSKEIPSNTSIKTLVPDDVTEMIEMIKKLPLVKRAEAIIMIHKMLEDE